MIKLKYNGAYSVMCDFPKFGGIVSNGDIIETTKEAFDKKLKNIVHNDKKVWTEVKKEIKKKEDTEIK